MDWLCPGFNQVLGKQLTALHGNITAENTIRDVVPIVQTGDLHIAVYDLPNEILYTANAKADNETGPPMAYDRWGCIHIHNHAHTQYPPSHRVFVRLDMAKVFAEEPPTA